MSTSSELVNKVFGNNIRVRSCAIIIEKDKIVLTCHKGLNEENIFWAPPGGGVEFGETLRAACQREAYEETGLKIVVKDLLFNTEHVVPPLHAIEFFFHAKPIGGRLLVGNDPELSEKDNLIIGVAQFSFEELKALPNVQKHKIFHNLLSLEQLYFPGGDRLIH